jgi:hypothetical protein
VEDVRVEACDRGTGATLSAGGELKPVVGPPGFELPCLNEVPAVRSRLSR